LFHVAQSELFAAKPDFGTSQYVAFFIVNPQYTGGLQHPACKSIKLKQHKTITINYQSVLFDKNNGRNKIL